MSESRVLLKPLHTEQIALYLELGIRSYKAHYLHLWIDQDPADYIQSSFTPEVVAREIENPDLFHYIAYAGSGPIGIVKLNASRVYPLGDRPASLLLEKIYLLRSASGKGYGARILHEVERLAREMEMEWLWLEAMQKGRALHFYLERGFEKAGETRLPFPNAVDEERPMFILIKPLSVR